jgi:hypothetical protein
MAAPGPKLTVRSLAEIVRKPANQRIRILHQQKYPKQIPQKFATPYYGKAVTAIRDFYRQGNDAAVLRAARRAFESLTQETRRDNNKRVIDNFERMTDQTERELRVLSNTRYSAPLSTIEVKLSADLHAREGEDERFIYYNCRNSGVEAGYAVETLEIAHWVLEQNEVSVPISALEYVDLFARRIYRATRRRSSLNAVLAENARIIEEVWPGL